MARAIGVRASLRHLPTSSSQIRSPLRNCTFPPASCKLSPLLLESHEQHSDRHARFCHSGQAKSITLNFQNQKALLLRSEFWGGSGVSSLTRRVSNISAFFEELQWGAGIAKREKRAFRTSPVMMGRRAAKIATRKGAQDKKKAKVYGRIGKQIISAVKAGGPDSNANIQLAAVLQAARQSNVPKDIIDRNIKKASDKDQAEYIQQTYEVYGAGGVAIVVEAFTDNLNRAAANIRDAVKKAGGKMADPGSVLFNFERKGIISVYVDELEPDDLMMAAMDAGADDVKLPEESGDSEEDEGNRRFKVVSEMDQFAAVKARLAEASIHIDEEDSGLAMVPLAHIEVDDAAAEVNEAIIERLLDLDDVDSVFSNMAV